jgi:hypothetical protein
MSGCITTVILLPFYSELVGSETGRKKGLKIKMTDDGPAKQKQNKMAAPTVKTGGIRNNSKTIQ